MRSDWPKHGTYSHFNIKMRTKQTNFCEMKKNWADVNFLAIDLKFLHVVENYLAYNLENLWHIS